MPRLQTLVLPCLLAAAFANAASAQCSNPWVSLRSIAGTDLRIHAIEPWDPDGAGPQPSLYVVGGDFTFAGTAAAAHVAIYDPVGQSLAPLGGGVDGNVLAITTLPTGELVVGGAFTMAGGVPANRIARWNGTGWSAMGNVVGNAVGALHVRANGELVAGVATGGPISATQVVRWNGASWSAVGSSLNTMVNCFASLPNGDLLAGGAPIDSSQALIKRWDGANWSNFGNTPTTPLLTGVAVLLPLPNGDILAGGFHVESLGTGLQTNIARWNGSSWSAMGSFVQLFVYDLVRMPNGDIVGGFQGSSSAHGVRRWNGTTWSTLGTGLNGDVEALRVLPNGTLLAGGIFARPGVDGFKNLASWNGSAWLPASTGGAGPQFGVSASLAATNGDLVAAWMENANGMHSFHVGRWNGSTWTSIGSPDNGVTVLLEMPNGDLIAGGYFSSISGVAALRLARWNGTAWSPVGGGVPDAFSDVESLAVLPNGDLVVGGRFPMVGSTAVANIARFDGTTWFPFGPGLSDTVIALRVRPNGELIASGSFERDGNNNWLGRVARWNGSSWQSFGTGTDGWVSGLTLLPNGDLVVGGFFTSAGGTPAINLARWNGTWSAIGTATGDVRHLLTLPNGHVVAAGNFTAVGGVPANAIARWDGASWSPFGSGLQDPTQAPTMAWMPTGDLAVGGNFQTAGGVTSPYLARLSTTCPATATSTGTSCAGAGGMNVLTPLSLPWLGSTFRSRASGFAPTSIALHVLGLSTLSLPLPAILPQGVAGCVLTVTPDLLDARIPINGVVDLELPIHPQIAFVGFSLHQQVVALELSATLDIVALTSSNSLHLVKGFF